MVGVGYDLIVFVFLGFVEIFFLEIMCLRYLIDVLKKLYLVGFIFNLWDLSFVKIIFKWCKCLLIVFEKMRMLFK